MIDWSAPWFAPWREAGERVEARGAPLADALNAEPAPVRFTGQSALPEGTAYESFVFGTGRCPVRENVHDFFNGLVWVAFPQSKRAFNRLQAAEIARDGITARRGPVRDAITVFDENGAILHAPPPVWDALVAREWRKLFVDLRPLWRGARLTVFGHALLEQLVQPRKDLTVHVWREPAPAEGVDGWLAARVTAETLAQKPFTPLPVLGVPGWWPANENFSFYDDSFVFRPRPSTAKTTNTTRNPTGT